MRWKLFDGSKRKQTAFNAALRPRRAGLAGASPTRLGWLDANAPRICASRNGAGAATTLGLPPAQRPFVSSANRTDVRASVGFDDVG